MNILFSIFILSLSLFTTKAHAVPAQVLIIRHAEEPKNGDHLSKKGQLRARALVPFFLSHPSVNKFGPPVAIFAAAPRKKGKSERAYETVVPLARRLNIKVDLNYNKLQTTQLVRKILNDKSYDGKTVLISWVRETIPFTAYQFGALNAPEEWEKDIFDQVWKLEFNNKEMIRFTILPQEL